MQKKICTPLTIILLFISLIGKSQVSVVNIQLLPYNITPESMLSAAIMNSGDAQQVEMVSKLYNFNNELLLMVKSAPFNLKNGLNSSFDLSRKAIGIEYSSNNQSNYIKTTHSLPSGAFKICVEIIISKSVEIADQFCDEVESDFNQYLYLVYPSDKDTIDTSTPLLIWSHSEPFSVLSQGEYYRMVVTEIKEKQGPDEAVTVNTPLMAKNYLTVHNLQYPYDAKELEEGKHYAWQVQKLANGVITNKTEAWEFIVNKKPETKEIRYVALKQSVDASYYTAFNSKIFFKFNEGYNSHGNIMANIKSDKGESILVSITKDDLGEKKSDDLKIKSAGDNRFILDLDKQNIKPGFYLMEIRNEKKEVYYLKFYFP